MSYTLKNKKIYTTFDEYVLEKQIGQGGNGFVYSAQNSDNQKVAVKIVERKNLSSSKIKRFKNELNFCHNHDHQNIIKVIDSGTIDSQYLFYVMPYCKETLRDRMKRGVSSQDAFEIFIALLKGIKYAHEKKVYHRDIKPENILFKDDGNEAIIADFGIAHFTNEEAYTYVETSPHERLANFQYAAPEQRMKGQTVDGRADIYALGLILNEMFTNKIAAGLQYTKIEEIDSNYDFLDSIFEKLYCQNPLDRLYPAEKILLDIKILRDEKNRKNKIKEIQSFVVSEYDKNIEIVNPSIIDIDFKIDMLTFILSENMPDKWYKILTNGDYSHSVIMGFDTDVFKGNRNRISVRLRGYETENTFKCIVDNLKQWMQTATGLYNRHLKSEFEREQREKENARIKEIERLKKENHVNSLLKSLI